jgi:hypothetical protein
MIEITSYARRYRTMRDEGPRGFVLGSERSRHRRLNPALNSVGFEGCNEPAGLHRRVAEQEHADLFMKEFGGERMTPPKKAMARDFEEAGADGPRCQSGQCCAALCIAAAPGARANKEYCSARPVRGVQTNAPSH